MRFASFLTHSTLVCFFLTVIAFSAPISAQEARDVSYTYDKLGRLETVTYQGLAADGGNIVYTYAYDPAGNRTTLQVEGNAFATVYLEDVYAVEGQPLQIPVFSSATLRGAVSFDWQITTGSGQVQVASRQGTFSLTAAQAVGLVGQIGTIQIDTINDSVKENHTEITIEISEPVDLWIDPLDNTSSIFLQDDDVTYFTFSNQSALEGTTLTYTVNKVSPPSAPSETITVTFSTEDLEALLVTDYEQVTPLTLDFGPSDTALDVTVSALNDAVVEADERLLLKANWVAESLYSGIAGAYGTIEDGPTEPIGEELFTSAGTYNWVVPAGVTSVNAVCIGGGGAGGVYSNLGRVGGGGGGLGWKNNIAVTPGGQITVIVGAGGVNKQAGTDSSFGSSVVGGGGTAYSSAPADNTIGYKPGGGFTGDGGGAGGSASMATYTGNDAGGGGAGGYTGSGGRGGIVSSGGNDVGQDGSGGGGAGGGISGSDGLPGGGVSLNGGGANGVYNSTAGGQGGSGGGNASGNTGGQYGGGGGSVNSSATGGSGACRVMWGPGLSFPNAGELSDATPGGGDGSPSIFSVSSAPANEGTDGVLTVSRPSPADRAYVVALSITGTASDPGDYTVTYPAGYAPATNSLQFDVGDLSQNISFSLLPDSDLDDGETIVLEAAWSDTENGAQTATGTLTINNVVNNLPPVANNETIGLPLTATGIVSQSGNDIHEGSTTFDVLANDTDPDGDTLTLKPGSITATGTYSPISQPTIGTVNGRDGIFAEFVGCATYTINYTVQDGNDGENAAQLTVTATGAANCASPSETPPPPPPLPDLWIEGPTADVTEGGDLTYTVKMSNAYSGTITVVWQEQGGTAIKGTDYHYPSAQLERTFYLSPGETQESFTVSTIDDADVVDADKTLIIGFQSIDRGTLIAPLTATGTILDNDVAGNNSPLLQPDYYTVAMADPLGNGNYFGDGTFNVLANDSDLDTGDTITLLNTVALMPGYGGLGSISVVNGQVYGTFTQCGRYRFEYEVEDSVGAKSSSFIDVRTDQDNLANCPVAPAPLFEPEPVVTIGDAATVTEGATLLFPITLSKTYPDPVRIRWAVTTNTDDVSVTSGILNFNPGDALTKNISLPTVDETTIDGTQNVIVTLASTQTNAVVGTANTAIGTVFDNENHPSFSIAGPGGVDEGGDLIYTVSKTGSSALSYTVDYTITLGSTTSTNDIGSVAMSGSLTFASGDTSKTVVVPTVNDTDWEQAEGVTVTLTSVSGGGTIGTASGLGQIANNDGEPIINIFNTSVFEGSSTGTVTVTVFLQGGTSEPVTVNYRTTAGSATAGVDYVEVASGSMTIQPGVFEGTFTVTINGDSTVEADEYFNTEVVSAVNASTVTTNINASNPTKGSNGIVTIKNDDVAQTQTYSDSSVSWSGVCSGSGLTGTESGTYVRTCTWSPSGATCGSQTLSTSRSCNIPQTATYSNGPTTWGACSSGGSRTGSYVRTCTLSPSGNGCGSTTISVTDNTCQPPVTYTWNTGSYGGWNACTGQSVRSRTRSVTCVASTGGTAGDSNCSGPKPATSEDGASCSYSWNISWGAWSCVGVGSAEERSGSVTCKSSTGNTVSNGNCSGTAPANSEVRNNPAVCGGGF